MTVLMTSVFLTEQVFAGTLTCEECEDRYRACTASPEQCMIELQDCWKNNGLSMSQCRPAVGGNIIQMETTSILAAGAQYTAAWMIPTLIAAAGIGIVIARKI